MEKLIEMITGLGMEQFAENTRQEIVLSDEVILKDLEDEKNLERYYEEIALPKEQRMFLNDYIACMKTADRRYADISYVAGIKDTIRMLSCMGLLKESEIAKQ
ncbi:MAG: hypothetical protein HFH93_10305 [Lachnospiraceae bacterium]|nr:hypothetical protein [Lachnospiraceae bacterium]